MSNEISNIQSISYNDIQVSFSKDAFLNATAIAEQFGKRVGNYLQNERTSDYINAIVEYLAETGNPVTDKNQLVIVKKGGNDKKAQGTWLHPKLAIDFARWLNPKFAVWCDMQIEKILNFNNPAITEQRHTISVEQQSAIRIAVKKRCKSDSVHYATVYEAIKEHFDIPRYTELLASDFDECIALIESVELNVPQITQTTEKPFFLSKNMAREFQARLIHIFDLIDLLDESQIKNKVKNRIGSLENFLIKYEKIEHPNGIDLS